MKRTLPSFDTLLYMAQNEPEKLEEIRYRLADHTINAAPLPLRQRLRGLQFKIDSTRKMAKTPLAACIRISDMMHESFSELRTVLNKPSETQATPQELSEKKLLQGADIIPFSNSR